MKDKKKKVDDGWDSPSDPIEDMKRALMWNDAISEREAEIMIEGLMGKRAYEAFVKGTTDNGALVEPK